MVSGKCFAILKEDLKQTKPFVSLEEEVYLNLQRTAGELLWSVNRILKSAELSPSQYNVLSILRGAGREGAICSEIGERLVTKDSDITRLLDRLEACGLIRRARVEKDRRIIRAFIKEIGLGVLVELDEPITQFHRRQLEHLGDKRLRSLSALLEAARK